METEYGLQGTIVPEGRLANFEEFKLNEFDLQVQDGSIAIGYGDPSQKDRASQVVEHLLAWYSVSHGASYRANLNQSWEPGLTLRESTV